LLEATQSSQGVNVSDTSLIVLKRLREHVSHGSTLSKLEFWSRQSKDLSYRLPTKLLLYLNRINRVVEGLDRLFWALPA